MNLGNSGNTGNTLYIYYFLKIYNIVVEPLSSILASVTEEKKVLPKVLPVLKNGNTLVIKSPNPVIITNNSHRT